jgi:hypothetical protein
MMAIFIFENRRISPPSRVVPGMSTPNGNWKNECIVTPPALMAATPVGATTTIRLGERLRSSRRNVVLPVPARPVRKTFSPVEARNSLARSICELEYMRA